MKTKQLITLFITIFITNIGFAQVGDQYFNYKALITQNGNVLANQTVNIRFTLTYTGVVQYQETQTATTDANGILTVDIGAGTATTGVFQNLYWGFYYLLKVEIDTGSGYQNFGENYLKYVPKAKWADKAASAENVDFSSITNVPEGLSDGDDVNDADHDATNEIQHLSISNNQISLSNSGGSVIIPDQSDADFYKSGTTIPPTSIDDNIYHNGKIGIGNVAFPSELLEIRGHDATIKLQDFGNHTAKFRRFTDRLYLSSDDKIQMGTDGNLRADFQIAHNGNVSIGTTSSTGRLLVNPVGNLNNGGTLDMSNAGLVVGDANTRIGIDANQIESEGSALHVNYSSDNDVIIGKGGGKVGIGTAHPHEKLVIKTPDSVSVKVLAANNKKSRLQLYESGNYGYELEYDGANDELNLWSKKYTGNEAVRTTWKKNGEVEINGKITSESSRNNADLKVFAYGNIYWTNGALTKVNSTNNFNLYHDSDGVFQIRLYNKNGVEIPFDFNNFTIVATAHTQEPVIITTHKYSNRLYFNLYNASTSGLYSTNFSFVIYKK
ncbi:MAG TPA: hypothetical protein ENK64_02230 [Flavobacteriales bacterium]|nr:hypothetical protein [Flavobacteriales bacterium]